MLRCVNEELFDDVPFGVGQITIPFEEHPYFAALPSADVHAGDLRVVRRVDGAKPQPPQKMTYDNFLRWLVKQKSQAKEVFSCSEAGPTGYWLHRKLIVTTQVGASG